MPNKSSKTSAYFIVILILHEVTIGIVIAFLNSLNAQWFMIIVCRLLQYPSCICALYGISKSNPAYVVPFMLSQVSLGSYADLHTYIQLVSQCAASSSTTIFVFSSPIILIVIPILIYAILLIIFIYSMYTIVRKITVFRGIVPNLPDEFIL